MRTTMPVRVSLADPAPPIAPVARRVVSAGVMHVREYLCANPVASITLDQLARMAGLSKYHLLRVFACAFGLSPRAFQMRLRLELARRYIEEGRRLTFVAYDAGFADQSHLTRCFKTCFGVTPGEYRDQGRGTIPRESA